MEPLITVHTPPGGAPSAPPYVEQQETTITESLFRSSIFQPTDPSNAPRLYPTVIQAPTNNYVLENSQVQVSSFRTNPKALYNFQIIEGENSYSKEIGDMPNYPNERAFQPRLDEASAHSPIHKWLKSISQEFLNSNRDAPLTEKMNRCERFVAQLTSEVILSRSGTQSLSEQPFFECFEIALRTHLFDKLIAEQNSQIRHFFSIHKGLPGNLAERETVLETFVTKNGFFINPDPNFFFLMVPPGFIDSTIRSCVSEANKFPLCLAIDLNERLIDDTMILQLNMETPSKISTSFECILRQNLSNTLILKQVEYFQEQYHKTGLISLDDFNQAAIAINNFLSSDGTFLCHIPVKKEILIKIFELPQGNHFPFQLLRNKIEQEKAAISKGLLSFLYRQPKVLLDNKLTTIAWAEQEWTQIINPPENIPSNDFRIPEGVPSAPDFNVEDLLIEQPLYSQEDTVNLEDDWELVEDPSPAVKSARPPAPLPEPVVVAPVQSFVPIQQPVQPSEPAPVRIYATDFNIPLVSYINLAFADRFKTVGDDLTVWNSLPGIIQRDALRHACHLHIHSGKAEDVAIRLFKTIPEIQKQLYPLEHNLLLPRVKTQLSPEFIRKGEELLNIYYSSNRNNFPRELQSLPRENLFYKYVYEMAVAAGVHIESWDHHFAENNWNKVTMMNLTVQALERCLHTDTK